MLFDQRDSSGSGHGMGAYELSYKAREFVYAPWNRLPWPACRTHRLVRRSAACER